MSETIDDLRASGRRALAKHAIEGREVDLLLSHVISRKLAWLIAHGSDPVEPDLASDFHRLIALRESGEPLQYLAGSTEFYGREFRVDERVLIPRPETEFLVEQALRNVTGATRFVVDVGTGSGCIAITLQLERPQIKVIAIDRSFDALLVARENSRQLGARLQLVAGDVLGAIRGPVSMIVSNPPYISSDEVPSLQREVQREPHMALSPGADAYEILRRLLAEGALLLCGDGMLLMEIGFGQSVNVRAIAEAHGWMIDTITKDLAGIDRVVTATPLPNPAPDTIP